MSSNSQEKIILHVDMKLEADSVIDTLRQNNIPAYCSATPDPNPLGLHGAIGINETGFDVFILRSDAQSAGEIIAGMGYVTADNGDSSQDAADTSDDKTNNDDASSPRELTDEEKRERLQKSLDELTPGKRIWYSICFAAIALVGLTVFVVLCDMMVEFIKSLFI